MFLYINIELLKKQEQESGLHWATAKMTKHYFTYVLLATKILLCLQK